MKVKRFIESRIRGWFPHEPSLISNPQSRTARISEKDFQRKYFKYFFIADAVVLQAFLGVNFVLVNPAYRDGFYSAVWWLGFTLTLISVNLLLYLRYKGAGEKRLDGVRQ